MEECYFSKVAGYYMLEIYIARKIILQYADNVT